MINVLKKLNKINLIAEKAPKGKWEAYRSTDDLGNWQMGIAIPEDNGPEYAFISTNTNPGSLWDAAEHIATSDPETTLKMLTTIYRLTEAISYYKTTQDNLAANYAIEAVERVWV